jgi:hypothetical protein
MTTSIITHTTEKKITHTTEKKITADEPQEMTTYEELKELFFKNNENFRNPLEKVVAVMEDKCRYTNGESLGRHNWGGMPIQLAELPSSNISDPNFKEELMKSLEKNECDSRNNSIIELLWGDIQIGKRVQACMIMWISTYILNRPVLYIFRNLSIDQKQLHDDITGSDKHNFNTEYIQNMFEEFNEELQETQGQPGRTDYWKNFKLPDLKETSDKMSSKNGMAPTDIFCCLMNHTQLEKVNDKFNEYIITSKELVNITILVDESDLMAPSASNDKSDEKDKIDSTKCEKLLATLYKKARYTLHITGTAHSLLYNITTKLGEDASVCLKISKVHKMKRSSQYYGLFNDRIHFNTTTVTPWWSESPEGGKKKKYTIEEDYELNIKNIIEIINGRKNVKYNSLLISEEKIRANQFKLVYKIMNDFPNLFIVVFHGNCLRLYMCKKYVDKIKKQVEKDAKQSGVRLNQCGGIRGNPTDNEKSSKFPNDYCYFEINPKKATIKQVFKVLRMLFTEENDMEYKTVVTITGKYGERGYSFTSDDYSDYSFHLTDQYFVSHSSFNCTDISQRMRLQGKYDDSELRDGTMELTLWTTDKLEEVICGFYVKFIKGLEERIMDCKNWEDIKSQIESIIDTGESKYTKYMKYLDVSKKCKNIDVYKCYDSKLKGYNMRCDVLSMTEEEIKKWCLEQNLPEYICVNEIKETHKDEFTEEHYVYDSKTPLSISSHLHEIPKSKEEIREYIRDILPELNNYKLNRVFNIKVGCKSTNRFNSIEEKIEKNEPYTYLSGGVPRPNSYNIINYEDEPNDHYPNNDSPYNKIHITITTDVKILKKSKTDPVKHTPYSINGNIVSYSVIKEEFLKNNRDELPQKYYWKTPDGHLFLHDTEHKNAYNYIKVKAYCDVGCNIVVNNTLTEDIKLFTNECFRETKNPKLRTTDDDVYVKYRDWCKKRAKKHETKDNLKVELEKLNHKVARGKGVDIDDKPAKGFNVALITETELQAIIC